MPGDDDLLDMIRAGVNTIPGIAHKIYGYPTGYDWLQAKTKVLNRLRSLKKYGMVRQTGEIVYVGRGNAMLVWEVIE